MKWNQRVRALELELNMISEGKKRLEASYKQITRQKIDLENLISKLQADKQFDNNENMSKIGKMNDLCNKLKRELDNSKIDYGLLQKDFDKIKANNDKLNLINSELVKNSLQNDRRNENEITQLKENNKTLKKTIQRLTDKCDRLKIDIEKYEKQVNIIQEQTSANQHETYVMLYTNKPSLTYYPYLCILYK